MLPTDAAIVEWVEQALASVIKSSDNWNLASSAQLPIGMNFQINLLSVDHINISVQTIVSIMGNYSVQKFAVLSTY